MILKNRKLLIALLTVLLLVPYTLVVLILSDMPGGQVLFDSQQPPNVSYGSFDPYEIKIINGPIQWDVFGWPRSAIIKITPKGAEYGHYITTDIRIDKGEKVSANWTNKTIEISFPLGHKLIIPKEIFIGGR